jgi:hypothetical protein
MFNIGANATSTWTEYGAYRVQPSDSLELIFWHSGFFPAGSFLYMSDVAIGYEPIPAPVAAGVGPEPNRVNWMPPSSADYFTSHIPEGAPGTAGEWLWITEFLRVFIERRFNGGSWSQIYFADNVTSPTTPHSYLDTTATESGYEWRVRYGIFTAPGSRASGAVPVAYTDWSAVISPSLGGWGVGLVRMGN